MNREQGNAGYQRNLGDGLLLRWSTPADAEALALLVSSVFREHADAPRNTTLGRMMYELMSGAYPLMGSGDFALIEDRSKPGSPLVACTCLWRHTWEYEGISFAVGRPEIVASDPAYRHRGLIRALFDLIHVRSEAEGHLVQGITGIPYFYRLFGYEYALELGGSRTIFATLIPSLQEGSFEPFTLRDATREDIPLIQQLYDQRRKAGIVSVQLGEAWWHYQIANWKTSETGQHWHIQIIVDVDGHAQGYLITQTMRSGNSLSVIDMAFVSGAPIQEMVLPLLRALALQGASLPARESPFEQFSRITFHLGNSHPIYESLPEDLNNAREASYAWYIRVAHLSAFIRHIAPVLEQRLAHSIAAGYSGELILDFYRSGLRLVFAKGLLTAVEQWRSPVWNAQPDGRFPALTFLQMLFGYRSLEALRAAFPDVRIKDHQKEVLLNALFPARASWVIE